MKKIALLNFLMFCIFLCKAQEIKLWGIDIAEDHPEISSCKVIALQDNTIFGKVKISSNSYTFANEQPNYSCWYGEESVCFLKVTEYLTGIFGKPLEVYSHDNTNSFTDKPSFFNIWEYHKGTKHYLLLLFGSGEGMTLDVNYFPSDKQTRMTILATLRSFHFAIRPELQYYLEK